jgi:hypothetical protein
MADEDPELPCSLCEIVATARRWVGVAKVFVYVAVASALACLFFLLGGK